MLTIQVLSIQFIVISLLFKIADEKSRFKLKKSTQNIYVCFPNWSTVFYSFE